MSLIDQVHSASQQQRTAAAKRYRDLLSRSHSPEPGDAAEVLTLMDILGRKPMDLEHDAELLRQAVEHEAAKAAADKLLGAMTDARQQERAAQADALARREALEAELRPSLDAAAAATRSARAAVEVNAGIRRMTEAGFHAWSAIREGISLAEYHVRRQAEHRREPAPPPTPQPYTEHTLHTDEHPRRGEVYTASNPAHRSRPFEEPAPAPVAQPAKKPRREYTPQVTAMPELPGDATEQDLNDEVERIRRGRQCADQAQGV